METFTKKDMCDFAYWYHNGLLNRERPEPEEALKTFIEKSSE